MAVLHRPSLRPSVRTGLYVALLLCSWRLGVTQEQQCAQDPMEQLPSFPFFSVGYGTAFFADCTTAHPCSDGWEYVTCGRCMDDALAVGYRSFDLAELYDGSEDTLGRIGRQRGVPREELFLTSKAFPRVWNENGEERYEAEQVLASFQQGLDAIGTDYLDLYLLHWHAPGWQEAWAVLERLKAEGKVRAIGVSNFDLDLLKEMWATVRDPPQVVQILVDPVYQSKELRDWCQRRGMAVIGYSSISYINDEDLDTHESSRSVLDSIAAAAAAAADQVRLGNGIMTRSHVVLLWLLQEGVSIIPLSRNRGRMEENFRVLDEYRHGLRLSASDMDQIRALDQPNLDVPPPGGECQMLRKLVVC